MRRMRLSLFLPAPVFLFGALVFGGCSSSSPAQNAAPPPSLCATDSRAETYASGMEQKGAAGAIAVKLLSITPNPVFKGNNDWTIQVIDANGAPIANAAIAVKPFMPDHGHGSSITPQVTAKGDPGTYDVSLLNLFMPGIWTVTFVVTTTPVEGPATTDQSVFTFCVNE